MGVAYRLKKPELTVLEVKKIREGVGEFAGYRLTTSPFGVSPDDYARDPPLYLGRAVAWKGAAGMDDTYRKALAYGKGAADRLITGLKKAVKISKAYAGTMGTTIYEGKLYPAKCIAQKRWKEEHPEIK